MLAPSRQPFAALEGRHGRHTPGRYTVCRMLAVARFQIRFKPLDKSVRI